MQLSDLPPTSVYLGRSKLDLDGIRRFNALQNMRYELNRNDCRHYVDTIVHEATGLERATAHLMRTSLRQRQEQGPHRLTHKVEKLAQRALEKDITSLLSNSTLGFSALTVAHVGVRFLLRRGRGALAAASGHCMVMPLLRGRRMSSAPGHGVRGGVGLEGRGWGGGDEHDRRWMPRAAMSSRSLTVVRGNRLCSILAPDERQVGVGVVALSGVHRVGIPWPTSETQLQKSCVNFVTSIVRKAGGRWHGVSDEDSIASLAVLNQFEL